MNRLRTSRPVAKLRQGRNDWYRIENKAGAPAEVYIYDEIGYFGITAQDFVQDLNEIKAKKIILHLNTPGGDVFDGIAIFNAIRNHEATVEVVVDSLAASAGAFIAQAGDTRLMNKGGQMMIHDAWGLAIGNATDMTEMADLLDKQSDNIAAIFAERSGRSAEEFRDLMRAETWFNADEAVEAGLADEVKGKVTDADAENSFDLSVFTYAGRKEAPAPPATPEPDAPPSEPDLDLAAITNSLKEAFA